MRIIYMTTVGVGIIGPKVKKENIACAHVSSIEPTVIKECAIKAPKVKLLKARS